MTFSPIPTGPTRAPGPIRGIGFSDAYTRYWRMGFRFAGRASRSEYWFVWLANTLILTTAWVLDTVLSFARGLQWLAVVIAGAQLLYCLAAMIPTLSLAVRRLHDNNKSGAMLLLSFIPFGGIVLFIFTVSDSDPAGARFDAAPAFVPPPVTPAAHPALAGAPTPPPPPPPPVPVAPVPVVPVLVAPPVPPVPVVPQQAAVPLAEPRHPALIAPPPSVASPFGEDVGDLDSTRMASPLGSTSWVALLLDGTTLPLSSSLLVGRAPGGDGGESAAQLVPLDDPTKSVSKTHARIDVRDGRVVITDLHSTNGTKVTADGVTTSLAPGAPWPLAMDADVVLGSYPIRVRRS